MAKFRFIHSTRPSDAATTQAKKVARSHSARETHARTRREMTMRHQAQGTSKQMDKPGSSVVEAAKDSYGASSQGNVALESTSELMAKPLDLLAAYRKDPFDSTAASMGHVEAFLFHHYATAVIPYMNASCGIFLSHEIFLKDTASRWLRLAVTDAAFMRSLMLTAARHLSQQSQSWPPGHHLQQYYQTLASQYKVASLQAVIQVIPEAASTRHVTDAILAIVMVLASDELWLGNRAMQHHHIQGAIKMVDLIGGPDKLGLDGFLQRVFFKVIADGSMPNVVDTMMATTNPRAVAVSS